MAATGKEITWDDVRKGDWLVVEQNVPAEGPRVFYRAVWAGEVVEHNGKWTYLKHRGKQHVIPAKWGEETITRYMKKDFTAYVKEQGW